MLGKTLAVLALVLCFLPTTSFAFDIYLKSGKVLRGELLSEDGHVIRLRDTSGCILSIKKETIDQTRTRNPEKDDFLKKSPVKVRTLDRYNYQTQAVETESRKLPGLRTRNALPKDEAEKLIDALKQQTKDPAYQDRIKREEAELGHVVEKKVDDRKLQIDSLSSSKYKEERYRELTEKLDSLRLRCGLNGGYEREVTRITGPGLDITTETIGNTTKIFGPGVDITMVKNGNTTRIFGPGIDITAIKNGNTTRITGPGVEMTAVTIGNKTRITGPGIDITTTTNGNTTEITGPGIEGTLQSFGNTTTLTGPGIAAVAVTNHPPSILGSSNACLEMQEVIEEREKLGKDD